MLVLVLPELLVAFWLLRLPESPRFFVANGETGKALAVLQEMYANNTRKPPERFPVKHLLSDVKQEQKSNCNKVSNEDKTAMALKKIFTQIRSLFKPPLLAITMLTCSIMFANMFG